MKDVLLFLGSGASVPFGLPTMKKLVELFEMERLRTPKRHSIDNEFMRRLYRYIKRILISTNGYADLESVFSIIEDISNNIEYKELGFSPTYVLSKYEKVLRGKKISSVKEQKAAINLLKMYKTFVRDQCKVKGPMEERISEVYKELFDALGNKYNYFESLKGNDGKDYRYGFCPIYTTNYDSEIETYWRGIALINDLWKDEKGIKVLDVGNISSDAIDIKLVKLHGSLNWFKLKDGKVVNLDFYQERYGKQPVEGELMLYPLRQKDLYLDPWFDLFKGFKYDLSRIKNWISIGYSFNDEFITNIFKEILKNHTHKLIIVSPHVDEIVTNVFSDYENIGKVKGKFGEKETISKILSELN
jgi:hypothetical protein